MERMEKQRLMDNLRRAGLWEQAEKYREEARQRLRAEGKSKQEAVEAAWHTMAERYLPLAVKPFFQTILPDGATCLDDIVDPNYSETGDVAQMRDVYRWVKEEFHRVVVERGDDTTVDFRLARRPPPIGLACRIVETWAAKPRDKRDGLYREIAARVAGPASAPTPEPGPDPKLEPPRKLSPGDEYLKSIGLLDE